jgi:subtilisin family serine protease
MNSLAIPWARSGDRQYSSPASLLLKMRAGEAPEAAPALLDVNQRVVEPARRLDGGPVDRIVRSFAGGLRAARLHASAANAMSPGLRHCDYDETEELSGVARTFLLRVAPGTPVGQLCENLSQVSTVESVSPNYISTTPFSLGSGEVDPAGPEAWLPRMQVNLPQALAIERGDSSVLVGLIDSGISKNHEELAGAFRSGYDTVRLTPFDVAPGIKLLGDHDFKDTDPTDQFVGHGMGCAGIIGGRGVRMPAGLGGAVQIIPMRALAAAQLPEKDEAVGVGAISDLDMAMKLAVDLKATVINMSFGTDDRALHESSPRPHSDVINYALSRGCILVAASGNNGQETAYWPAAYPDVIAVGAVDETDSPAAFSTRGNHVALCAPGSRVLTTALNGYQFATGTSFAAPFVSAAAALLASRAARRAVPMTAHLAREILVRTARPFAGGVEHSGCGAGILDAAAALRALDERIDQVHQTDGERHAA